MKIDLKKFALLLSALSPALLMTGCPDAYYCAYGTCYGYYYDSLVSGLSYESRGEDGVTHAGVTGEENDPGRFSFADGDTVSFSIGDVELGEVAAQVRVTPFDLAGIAEEALGGCNLDDALPEESSAFRKVVNLAVLLQTLDSDGDPEAGIEISEEVAALFEGVSVELDQARTSFQADTALQAALVEANGRSLFAEERAIVKSEDALRALYLGLGLCSADE